MTRLFRSKSCGVGRTAGNSIFYSSSPRPSDEDGGEKPEEDEEEEEDEDEDCFEIHPVKTPFIIPQQRHHPRHTAQSHQFPVLEFLLAMLRKSLVTCNVDRDDVVSMDIGWPTDVRHVSHVTFDRFNGFLGLPIELESDIPKKVPSASANVFGVSAKSMQCSYDQRRNSVPTILLMMQKRLYLEGGLQAEGIFRINAENSQEENVRNQLNKGIVPRGIDVHCLAGLIKAWFRELPNGVLDSLTPEQVMHCNTEQECTQLLKLLPQTEAALLDWAINLMADVVQHENQNKMNARNIAMVFAPNMTQMADPLTALIHAVQVMNFLKTLIIKTLREREQSAATARLFSSFADSFKDKDDHVSSSSNRGVFHNENSDGGCTYHQEPSINAILRSATLGRLESDTNDELLNLCCRSDDRENSRSSSNRSKSVISSSGSSLDHDGCKGVGYENVQVSHGLSNYGLGLRKGVRKLCTHPVFQLGKPVPNKKGGGFAWDCK